jgi:hypothetical protein
MARINEDHNEPYYVVIELQDLLEAMKERVSGTESQNLSLPEIFDLLAKLGKEVTYVTKGTHWNEYHTRAD